MRRKEIEGRRSERGEGEIEGRRGSGGEREALSLIIYVA